MMVNDFVTDVKKNSNGRLTITPFAPGALAKPLETYDAVSAGAVEMAFSTGIYHARKVKEGLVEFGLPMSFEDLEQFYEFYYDYEGGKAFKLISEAYEERGTHLLGFGPTGQYGWMTTFPVHTLDDMKGKKMRSFALFSVLVQKLGGAPVSLPGAEQYMALQRGTIDGTIYPIYVLETYKLKEVVKYVILPFILVTPSINFYVNLKAWNKLPDDIKRIAEKACMDNFPPYSRAAKDLDWKNLEIAKKERGIKVMRLPEGEAKKLREIAQSTWPVARKTDRSATMIDMMKAFFKEKGR
jgi:TRAP-type C4-dicarboxylate transport system substrate-binding protein